MIFDSVNLLKELERERDRQAQEDLIEDIQEIFHNDLMDEALIRSAISKAKTDTDVARKNINLDQLDATRIFGEREIKALCTKYRLRFLKSHLFKGEIPFEAFSTIKSFEKTQQVRLPYYFILAPSTHFELSDCQEDPMLMAPLGDGRYYLLHQWGSDMEWYHSWLNFPLRNISTLALTATVLGLFLALLLPAEAFVFGHVTTAKVIFFKLFSTFILSGLVFISALITGIVSSRDFSSNVWNSKYFN